MRTTSFPPPISQSSSDNDGLSRALPEDSLPPMRSVPSFSIRRICRCCSPARIPLPWTCFIRTNISTGEMHYGAMDSQHAEPTRGSSISRTYRHIYNQHSSQAQNNRENTGEIGLVACTRTPCGYGARVPFLITIFFILTRPCFLTGLTMYSSCAQNSSVLCVVDRTIWIVTRDGWFSTHYAFRSSRHIIPSIVLYSHSSSLGPKMSNFHYVSIF